MIKTHTSISIMSTAGIRGRLPGGKAIRSVPEGAKKKEEKEKEKKGVPGRWRGLNNPLLIQYRAWQIGAETKVAGMAGQYGASMKAEECGLYPVRESVHANVLQSALPQR